MILVQKIYRKSFFRSVCHAFAKPAQPTSQHTPSSTARHQDAQGVRALPRRPGGGRRGRGEPCIPLPQPCQGLGLERAARALSASDTSATPPRRQGVRALSRRRGGGRRGELRIPLPSYQGLGHERAARAASSSGDRQMPGRDCRAAGSETWIWVSLPPAAAEMRGQPVEALGHCRPRRLTTHGILARGLDRMQSPGHCWRPPPASATRMTFLIQTAASSTRAPLEATPGPCSHHDGQVLRLRHPRQRLGSHAKPLDSLRREPGVGYCTDPFFKHTAARRCLRRRRSARVAPSCRP